MFFFFLMIRRPPRSTLDRSSAASDVYKRQVDDSDIDGNQAAPKDEEPPASDAGQRQTEPVSYTHLRAHETVLDLVCRLLLEKKKKHYKNATS